MEFHEQVQVDKARGLCELEIADKHDLTITELRNKVNASEMASKQFMFDGRAVGAAIFAAAIFSMVLYSYLKSRGEA